MLENNIHWRPDFFQGSSINIRLLIFNNLWYIFLSCKDSSLLGRARALWDHMCWGPKQGRKVVTQAQAWEKSKVQSQRKKQNVRPKTQELNVRDGRDGSKWQHLDQNLRISQTILDDQQKPFLWPRSYMVQGMSGRLTGQIKLKLQWIIELQRIKWALGYLLISNLCESMQLSALSFNLKHSTVYIGRLLCARPQGKHRGVRK